MSVCGHCGLQSGGDLHFCPRCGSPIPLTGNAAGATPAYAEGTTPGYAPPAYPAPAYSASAPFGQAPAYLPPSYGQSPDPAYGQPAYGDAADPNAATSQFSAPAPLRQDLSMLPAVDEYDGYDDYDGEPPVVPPNRHRAGGGGPPGWLIGVVGALLLIVAVAVIVVATRKSGSGSTAVAPTVGVSSPAAQVTPSPASSAASSAAASVAPAAPLSPATTPVSSAPASPTPSKPSTSAPATAPPSATEVAQAKALKSLMDQSTAAHGIITPAIAAIGKCLYLPSAMTTLSHAADIRVSLARAAAGADVSALANGSTLTATFEQAMNASAAADQNYAAWAQDVQAGCRAPAPHTAHYRTAIQNDAVSSTAKIAYAKLWNPLAKQLGLATITPTSL
jgi:hypothetical protein